MSIALYRRYRPQIFEEVIGQEHVTDPLMAALDAGRTTHAYLFSGPRGCGKTTSARILARCLNCVEYPTATPCGECDSCKELARGGSGSFDVVELDAASHGSVDDARELREQAGFAPVRDRFKIFIIDEAHMVTSHGFNALLKLVEEPPPHVKFIFATTEPEKVIGTIRSRTHHYPFRLVPPPVLESYLTEICADEGVEASPEILSLVVRAGTGSVRDTLSVLDQIIGGSDGVHLEYERAVALLGYTSAHLLDASVEAIAKADGARLFGVVDDLVRSGHDPRRFAEDLLQRLRDLVILSLAGSSVRNVFVSVPDDQFALMEAQAEMLGARRASRSADLVNEALSQMLGATAPRLQLELLCARLVVAQEALANNSAGAVNSAKAEHIAAAVTSSMNSADGVNTASSVAAPSTAAMPNNTTGGNAGVVTAVNVAVAGEAAVNTSNPSNMENNSERRVKPNERPMPQITGDIAGIPGVAVPVENTSTVASNTPAASMNSAGNASGAEKETAGEAGSSGGPVALISASWAEIMKNAANRAPAAINLFQTLAQPKTVENNVVSIPLADKSNIETFNRNFAVLDAIAFAIYDVTKLKTRIQGVFDPVSVKTNVASEEETETQKIAGDVDPKEHNDSSDTVNQEPSHMGKENQESNSENFAEFNAYQEPETFSAPDSELDSDLEPDSDLDSDPAGILGAILDGQAIFITPESSMKNTLDGVNSAVTDQNSTPVPNIITDAAQQEEVPEDISRSTVPATVPPAQDSTIVPAAVDTAPPVATTPQVSAPTAAPQVPFFAQDLPSVPPMQDPFKEPEPDSPFAALVNAKTADNFSDNGKETDTTGNEAGLSGANSESESVEYGDDWDAVTDEDPELDVSQIYGVEVAIKAFDARVIKEHSTQEEGI